MKILTFFTLTTLGICLTHSESIEQAKFFKWREGKWKGTTTSIIPISGVTFEGGDQNECRLILNDSFAEISGSTNAMGERKQYRWIYRIGDKPNTFNYVYLDSKGNFDEGTATYSPENNSLKSIKNFEKTNRKSITTSKFKGENSLEIEHKLFDKEGNLLFKGLAIYKRESTE